MRRTLLVGAAAAAAAVAAVLLLARGGSAPAIAATAPIAVRATFDRAVVEFGDPFTAQVVVTLDRNAVRPQTLKITNDVAPLTALAAPVTVRTVTGGLETVSITQQVACFTDPCLAPTITLPKVHASATSASGVVSTRTTAWRRLQMRSRVTSADLAASTPRFAADTSPGPPAYRVAPATATRVLEIVAALGAAGAVALLALEASAFSRRRRRAVTGDELARALRLAREAEGRPTPDRRRALALLARLLRSRDGALGSAASDLAWSEPAPEPPAVEELVARVERERAE
jgi:hypothetical protein